MILSKRDMTYFNIAKEISKLSDFPRVRIGSCAVYKHKVISTGFNTTRTHPLQKKYNKYRFNEKNLSGVNHACHAEVSCLKPLIGRKDIDFKNVHLYIYREDLDGNLALSKPCESCQMLIKELGIRHVYYTSYNEYFHEIF